MNELESGLRILARIIARAYLEELSKHQNSLAIREKKGGGYMPIKGLTQVRRLPRLGKIKMGIKVKTTLGVEYPQRLIILSFP